MLRVDRDLVLAVDRGCYRRWRETLEAHAGDVSLLSKVHSPEAVVALTPGKKSVGDIAVIRLSGFITQKPSLFTILFGGTSAEMFAATVYAAMTDPAVGAVVLDVDSPGGEVFGIPEAAAVIRAARGSKPFIAISNPFMASAAYWLGSQADEIVALPSSLTGSIGVYAAHVSEEKALEKVGLEVTELTYGRRKAEQSSAHALSDEARAAIEKDLKYYGLLFERDVAKGRGTNPANVHSSFGEGACFTANDAKASGMVDRIGTLDQVIGELASGRRPAPRALAAAADPVETAARAALAGVRLPTIE
jgi:signal peptide peptidase SppA